MPAFTLTTNNKEDDIFPDNRNNFIFCINSNPKRLLQYLQVCNKKLNESGFNANIIAITGVKKINAKNDEILTLRYNPQELGEFLGLSDDADFTLFIDSTNTIKYFDYRVIDSIEFELIIDKYTIENKYD